MPEIHRRIRFVETLGQGGFGAVYLADVQGQSGFLQRLAIKILSAEMNEVSDIAARQRDEARLLAQLNHHAIVKVFDLINISGRPAVLMEYVEGVDAAVLSRGGPMPPRATLQIIATAADALHVAATTASPHTGQSLSVIHRDIKPANLLVSRHGGVKVLDFGIARAEFDREGITSSQMYGSARYMAPEQWLYGHSSHAVDIYSLGVSTVELLTGKAMERPPLVEHLFVAHVGAAIERLPAELPCRPALTAFLTRMMAFEPEVRPDALTVSETLLGLCDEMPGEGLSRYARRVIPPLIEARKDRYARNPLPGEVSFYQEVSQAASALAPMPPPRTDEISATMDHPAPTVGVPPPATVSRPAPTVAEPADVRQGPPRWVLHVSILLGLSFILVVGGVIYRSVSPGDAPVDVEENAAIGDGITEADPITEVPVTDNPLPDDPVIVDPGEEPPPEQDDPDPGQGTDGGDPVSSNPVQVKQPDLVKPQTDPGVRQGDDQKDEVDDPDSTGGTKVTVPPPDPPPDPPPEEPEVVVEKRAVRFGGPSFGTQVYVGGALLGKTPLTADLPLGSFRVTMKSGDDSETGTCTVKDVTLNYCTWKTDDYGSRFVTSTE